MVELGERLAAIELVVAAQAIDLRGRPKLGRATAALYARVRELIPATARGERAAAGSRAGAAARARSGAWHRVAVPGTRNR